jgi:hypothetical protein
MEVAAYLQSKGLGYENLSEGERNAISSFALIWTLFEAQLLDESASAQKIIDKSKSWEENRGIDTDFLDEQLTYFKTRYVENGKFTHRYSGLHFRRNDHEDLVKSVLLGTLNDEASKLACCLIIVLRFRNNYFHGIKWAYQFQEQRDNFEYSCLLLTYCMDRYAG